MLLDLIINEMRYQPFWRLPLDSSVVLSMYLERLRQFCGQCRLVQLSHVYNCLMSFCFLQGLFVLACLFSDIRQ